MNSLMLIRPYKYEDTWVFDDPAVGLKREPFIAGIDTMIDKVVADVPNADVDFAPSSAHRPFPVMLSNSNGGGASPAGIGITAKSFPWRAGFAQRSSNISRKRRVRFM